MSEFLVLGATGKTGRRVVAQLVAAGHTVRAAARNPGSAADGIVAVPFDWSRPSGHEAALAGVDGVYLVAPAERFDFADEVDRFVELARRCGVSRAVLLSARGADVDPSSVFTRTQRIVLESGLVATVLQPVGFAQNFTEGFLAPDADGAIHAPTGTGRMPFVDVADIAAVAVAALTDAGHGGRTYRLTGPSSLSFAEAAEVLSTVVDRDIRHVDVDPGLWRAGLLGAGVSSDRIDYLDTLFSYIRDGYEDVVDEGVERALGRPPASFAEWARREASAALASGSAA